jgi:hypothetical protein
MKSLKTKLLERLEEFCLNSSTHGIPSIYRSNNYILKSLWIVFTLGSTGLCFYLMALSIIEFLSYPVITNIEIVKEVPTLFPTVSFCNLNPYKTEDPKIDFYLKEVGKEIEQKNNHPDMKRTLLKKIVQQNLSKNEQKQFFGWQLKDMLFHCKFNSFPCNQTFDFEYFYNINYLNCYKFNGIDSALKKIGKSGLNSGLQLEIYIGKSQDSLTDNNGLRVIIHNYTEKKIAPEDEGINLEPGKKYSIGIKRTFYKKESDPYSECIDNLSLENYGSNWLIEKIKTFNFSNYLSNLCEKMNYQKMTEEKCNCSDASVKSINDKYEICSTPDSIKCQEIQFQTFYSNPIKYSEKPCLKGKYFCKFIFRSHG